MPIGSIGGGGTGDTGVEIDEIVVSGVRPSPKLQLPSSFQGYGYGGGGLNVTNFGREFYDQAIGAGFSPGNFGLPGTSEDYKSGGKFSSEGIASLTPGGYETTTTSSGGTAGVPLELITTAKQIDPMIGQLMRNEMSFNPSSSMLTPTMPSFNEPATGIFGGTLGPKLKNSLPGKIITGALKINPGTRGLMMGISLLRGLKNAENPAEFLRQGFTRMALSRALGGKGLGLSGMQRQGVGSLINMARGKQTLGQSIKSLGTSAAFRSAAPNLMKSAYKSGGMNGVYAAMAALQMAQRGIQQRIAKGPGGGG